MHCPVTLPIAIKWYGFLGLSFDPRSITSAQNIALPLAHFNFIPQELLESSVAYYLLLFTQSAGAHNGYNSILIGPEILDKNITAPKYFLVPLCTILEHFSNLSYRIN